MPIMRAFARIQIVSLIVFLLSFVSNSNSSKLPLLTGKYNKIEN